MLENALQLVDGQPTTKPSTRLLLGPLDERLPEALVQASAAVVIRDDLLFVFSHPAMVAPIKHLSWTAITFACPG